MSLLIPRSIDDLNPKIPFSLNYRRRALAGSDDVATRLDGNWSGSDSLGTVISTHTFAEGEWDSFPQELKAVLINRNAVGFKLTQESDFEVFREDSSGHVVQIPNGVLSINDTTVSRDKRQLLHDIFHIPTGVSWTTPAASCCDVEILPAMDIELRWDIDFQLTTERIYFKVRCKVGIVYCYYEYEYEYEYEY